MKWISDEHEEGRLHVATISFNYEWYLVLREKYEEAGVMCQRALEAREKMLGRDHPNTLTCVSTLGSVLDNQAKYEEAEAMHRRALKAREKVLGPHSPMSVTLAMRSRAKGNMKRRK